MSTYTIPDEQVLRDEIKQSHARCRQLGVNPEVERNPNQPRLSRHELEARLVQNQDFLSIAVAQIEELYQFVAGAGFAVNIADKEGYILHILGDTSTVQELADGNCSPGYRWTEKDVGTSVISLSLARKIPVQINDDEHFCKRGHGHTCSASPVFDPENRLLGVIAMSGAASQVHPHTLGMVITAARAIENQLRISKTSRELLLHNNYMNAIIESIDSGVIAVDQNGIITQANNQAREMLQSKDTMVGRPIAAFFSDADNWRHLDQDPSGYIDRELFIKTSRRTIHLLTTAKPIPDSEGRPQGFIIVFNEINRIRRLVNTMAGSQAEFTFEDILGTSSQIQEAKKQAMLAAAGVSNVLLLGETGTGKELFAQAIHNQSDRRSHPFVAINCGAIPRELLESELFGYIEGAFTGAKKGGRPGKLELASGGTVFLDEIGDMPLDMQVKLLRVLQTGEVYRIGQHKPISVDLRIIAATHFDLKQEVARGNFREDLFYRLNVLPIDIPPLRKRAEDVALLATHILKRCSQVLKKPGVKLTSNAKQMLYQHRWPGNVRELENIMERAVNLVDGDHITPELIGQWGILQSAAQNRHRTTKPLARLQEMEKDAILSAIQESSGNFSRASKALGISRATLYNKLKRYNIHIERNHV